MLKYKNIKELTNEDDNKLNNIILKNYYKKDNSKNYYNNGWICVDIKYVFELINDTGKNILKLIDNSALNYLEYINSNIKIQKKLNKFYNDWINENGYPYNYYSSTEVFYLQNKNKIYDYNKFTVDCCILNIISNIHKILVKIEFYSLLTLDPSNSIFKKLITYITMLENFTNSKILKDNEKIQKKNSENYNFNSELLKHIKNSLVNILYTKTESDLINFSVSRQTAIYINNNYILYYSCKSLIGIAYYQLLIDITTNKYYVTMIPCEGPGCFNELTKIGNNKYCIECKENKIPQKIKRRNSYIKEQTKKLENDLSAGIINIEQFNKKIKRLNHNIK